MSFTLVDSYNMSMSDIENMIIWERDIYITLLNNKIEKENQKIHPEFIDIIVDEICKIPNLLSLIHEDKPKGKERDELIELIKTIIDENAIDKNDNKIVLEGDPIIQIGTVFHDYGTDNWYRNILVIGPKDNMKKEDICDTMDNLDIDVVCCPNEEELLIQWAELIKEQDPDFITGYNIFGFDFRYIQERVDIFWPCPIYSYGKNRGKCMCKWGHHESCPKKNFNNLGKLDKGITNHRNKRCSYKEQNLTSSALGENKLSYFTMDGRILFDIQKEVEKGHNLDSYKLDNVASHFMRGKIRDIND